MLFKAFRVGVTSSALAAGLVSAVGIWLLAASAMGKMYLTLAILWCCDSDADTAAIILDHDPSLVAAIACGITVACFVAAFWFIVRPGEKRRTHVKYEVLRSDR